MKKKTTLIFAISYLFIIASPIFAQDKNNLTLLDNWHQDSIVSNSSLVRYSGCWGFEWKENQYSVIGSTEGTHVFQIDNNKLRPIGFIKGKFSSSLVSHREFKTYKNYLYSICDEGYSSLQIIDLNYLPDSVSLVNSLYLPPFGRAHNLFIDTSNALLYLCKVTSYLDSMLLNPAPMRVFSLVNPETPLLLWEGPNDIAEVHDIHVRDNEAILNCGFDGIRIYNFTNPSNPIFTQSIEFYNDQGYNHQGFLSPDKKTYVFADENIGMRIKKYHRHNNGSYLFESLFGTKNYQQRTPHNIQCDNSFVYVAYYNEGLRIFDMRTSPPQEIAFYNTYQPIISENTSFTMNGAWGVYKFRDSPHIIVSDRQNGLFLIEFNKETFSIPSEQPQVYPNPSKAGEKIYFRFPNDSFGTKELLIFDAKGKKIKKIISNDDSILKAKLKHGFYYLQFNYKNVFEENQFFHLSLVVI